MSRPRLVRSGTSAYSQVGSKDPDAMMSQNQYSPTTPASQKSNRQLGYDYHAASGGNIPALRHSPSQETATSARYISSPPPAHPGSRPTTSTGAVIPRPSTAQTLQPRDRATSNSNTQSYWNPLPRSHAPETYDTSNRPAIYKRHS
jgi:hypothetical protein